MPALLAAQPLQGALQHSGVKDAALRVEQREMTAAYFTARSKTGASTSSDPTVMCHVCEEGKSEETSMPLKPTRLFTRERLLSGDRERDPRRSYRWSTTCPLAASAALSN